MNTCDDCNVSIVWGDICSDCDDARGREADKRKFEPPSPYMQYLMNYATGFPQLRPDEPPSGGVR